METALVSVAALAAGTAYLNAKLGISTDLNELALAKEFTERVGKRIQGLGDTVTLYRVFELCNEGDEALVWKTDSLTFAPPVLNHSFSHVLYLLEMLPWRVLFT